MVWLLLARQGVEVTQATPLGSSICRGAGTSRWCGSCSRVRVSRPGGSDQAAGRLSKLHRKAGTAPSSALVARRAHGQVRLLAANAVDSLPADLVKELPGVAAQAGPCACVEVAK